MVDQPVNDGDTSIKTFYSSEYEEDIEKTLTEINRWFRNQDNDVQIYDIRFQNNITGYTEGGPFSITITYAKSK